MESEEHYLKYQRINKVVYMLVNLFRVNVQEWSQDPSNVYIGRRTKTLEGSKWGNPFTIADAGSREKAIQQFEEDIRNNKVLLEQIHELEGKNLGCWCHPKDCHGRVLKELLSEMAKKGAKGKTPKSSKPKRKSTRKTMRTAKGQYYHDNFEECNSMKSPYSSVAVVEGVPGASSTWCQRGC